MSYHLSGRPFQPSLIFVGKAKGLPRKELHLGRLHPYPQTFDKAGRCGRGKHCSLSRKVANYGHKMFYNIEPEKGIYFFKHSSLSRHRVEKCAKQSFPDREADGAFSDHCFKINFISFLGKACCGLMCALVPQLSVESHYDDRHLANVKFSYNWPVL